jgi:RNA polymerase sigma factor (sigma-70 family)
MSTDAVGDYFRTISDRVVLDRREECELARAIEVGVLARERLESSEPVDHGDLRQLASLGEAAFLRMVDSNLRLVVSIARKYLERGVPFADLIQDGNLGLLRAVQGFDHAKGFRFSTYATFWIRESIEQGITKQAHVIKIPHHQLGRLGTIRKLHRELSLLDGRALSIDELAECAALDRTELDALLVLDRAIKSLQEPIGDGETELGEILTDPAANDPLDNTIHAEEARAVRSALHALDLKERQVIAWTFGLEGAHERDLRDIASDLAITKPATTRLLSSGIAKLGTNAQLISAIA